MKKNNVFNNIISLYGLTIAKLVFPLITFPYLTRVLSLEAYGIVAYVKTIISYMQIVIDFAFVVSGTKDIVLARNDISKISKEASTIMFSRILLSIAAFAFLLLMIIFVPILQDYRIYALLSFVAPFLSIFLFDYVFRGIEKMGVITSCFFIMKGITTVLTFVFVKGDNTIIWIPILDIISSLIASIFAIYQLNKNDINPFGIVFSFKESIDKIKNGLVYFASSVTNVIFSSINSLIIGFYLSASDIAFWSICIHIVSSIQNMYNPIIEGLFPEMIKSKNFSYIKKALLAIMPLILVGCVFTYFISERALVIIGGDKFAQASIYLKLLIPVLFFGFPSMLFGWPTLGAIGKESKVTLTLVIASLFQIASILILILSNSYNLINISILRSITEVVLCFGRTYYTIKYKNMLHINAS